MIQKQKYSGQNEVTNKQKALQKIKMENGKNASHNWFVSFYFVNQFKEKKNIWIANWLGLVKVLVVNRGVCTFHSFNGTEKKMFTEVTVAIRSNCFLP